MKLAQLKLKCLNCQKSVIRPSSPCCSVLFCTNFFVFYRLINKNMFRWFLLIIQHALNRSITRFSRNHPTLCFWLRREGWQANAQYWTVILSNWKKQPPEVFYKNLHLHTAASELTLWSDCLELCFWIAFKTISTQ